MSSINKIKKASGVSFVVAIDNDIVGGFSMPLDLVVFLSIFFS
jgi:hypothetical protein